MSKKIKLKKIIIWVIVGIIVILFIFFRPIERVQFNNQNMEPTYKQGQTAWLIWENLFGSLKRGDIVSYDVKNGSKYFTSVARIIAIPGDLIMIKDGAVFLNNEKLSESYTQGKTEIINPEIISEGEIVKMNEDEFFLLCDNREECKLDSRSVGVVDGTPNIDKILETESFINGKILDF